MTIVADLMPLAKPIGGFRTLEGNPRRGVIKTIAKSLEHYGQRKPIVARDDGVVIAGNHTLQAALSLGWTEIAAVIVVEDVEVSKGYALADNKTSQDGSMDKDSLQAFIEEILDYDQELLDGIFSDKEIDKILAEEPEPDSQDKEDIDLDGLGHPETFNIIVKCSDEFSQDEALALLDAHGYTAEKMRPKAYV